MLYDVQAFGVVGHHVGQFGIQPSARHVVDDLRAMFQCRRRHRGACGVDGQYGTFGNQCIHGSQYAGLLVFLADALGAGPGGFGSDVDDVGPILHHRLAVCLGLCRIEPQSTV